MESNMQERPKCHNERCNNPGFVVAYRMILCGDCYMEINEAMAKKQSEQIKLILSNSDAS